MPDKRRDFLLEIGCEELPPSAVAQARKELSKGQTERALEQERLTPETVKAFATPRRIVLLVRGIPELQEAKTEKVIGPPKGAAYDAGGRLTAAGRGFLKKWKLNEADAAVEETDKGEYLVANVQSPTLDASETLRRVLPELFLPLAALTKMRWPQSTEPFPRPIRWLVSFLGGKIIPLEFAGVKAGARSYGHRTIAPGPKDLAAVFDEDGTIDLERLKEFYARELGVVVDVEDRRQRVAAQLKKIGLSADYFDRADYHAKWTLARVLDDVELPSLVAGAFDEKYLALPAEVVEAALLGYLHLFPIKNKKGELEPRFFAVHNARAEAEDNVRAGLERVLAARLADAAYFWEVDRRTPLEDLAAALAGVVFAEGAGTLADKAARLEKLTAALGDELNLTEEERKNLARAAALCKADLTSQMVREKEFAHLQGTMGKLYAEAAGEPGPVAAAIGEHYRPVAADDPLPATKLGRVLSLADRLDTLVTLFAAGHRPTGARDPFALRRAAIGLCRLLLEDDENVFASLPIEGYVAQTASTAHAAEGIRREAEEFIRTRLEQIFLERGFRDDMVDAVLALPNCRPADALGRLSALAALYGNRGEYIRLAIAFKRPINILRQGRERGLNWGDLDEKLMTQDEEIKLLAAYRKAEPRIRSAVARGDYDAALKLLAAMRPTVDKFFDEVMVMYDDERLRANRLALMQLLADLFLSFADFTRLRGEEEYE
ncbi:MAG: glycine--tRNA ligase subunit beta [candidate division Zixibacteria bacterium]|nr:glycine--tRNA ligase subunit beta [candidate division Zixibacteria bacterium]